MGMLDRLANDLRGAMKSRDDVALRTLRMLKAAVQHAAIAKRPAELSDAEETKVLRTEVKRREEAIVAYQRGGRPDLVNQEAAEVRLLKTYLPAGLDEAVVKKMVNDAVARLGATSAKDFGKVMGAVMREAGVGADGGVVSTMVHEALSAQQKKA